MHPKDTWTSSKVQDITRRSHSWLQLDPAPGSIGRWWPHDWEVVHVLLRRSGFWHRGALRAYGIGSGRGFASIREPRARPYPQVVPPAVSGFTT